ncbi:MAG: PH domain-containing protein [Gammaproteobacteria bacterium]|nr:PH domain-containing protein [Gammaproteobacteria bacterium]
MSYIEESLSEGEQVVARFNLHWVERLPIFLWCVLVITLPWGIYQWLKLRCTEIGLTNKRVVVKTGIISRHSEEMRIGSIETVEIDQSIWGRLFGFGNVRVTGKGTSDLVLRRMANPIEVKRRIEGVSHPAA